MLLKINGRTKFFDTDFIQVMRERGSKHSHLVTLRHGTYRVFGGRHAGGYSHEWFVEPIGETAIFSANGPQYFTVRSLVEGIRSIVNV